MGSKTPFGQSVEVLIGPGQRPVPETTEFKAARRRKLVDLMSTEMLQKVQDNFSAAVGVAMVIVDPEGAPVTKPSGFSPFCEAVRSRPDWRERCFHCDAVGGRTALSTGEPAIYKCHCQLVDFAAPINLRGEYLGAVICGQVKLAPGGHPRIVDLSNIFPAEGSWSEDPALLSLHAQIGEISFDRLRSAAFSLFTIASHIVEESYSQGVTQELYAKNLRLAAESQRRAELERLLREAELQALSYQVNPHFLFNVLNTIGRLALVEGAPETETTVHAFADMMRYLLKRSGSQFVPLRTEVDHVRNYLYLLKLRMGDRFDFTLDAPEAFDRVLCPFMVLHPLVENCINYAVEPMESGGLIEISLYRDGGDVILDVLDNGPGISAERRHDVLRGEADHGGRKSIGLHNIHSRMRQYFGDSHGLEIVSPFRQGRGTLVRLRLPIDFDPCAF
ncbi:PocR ligand-binding domain-containing protein [Rhodobacter capsulatus]|uniref:sensor histidine kinase n=1 Tax=Rhodobacter capsulatus TaxID=1061 RepID=UPI000A696D0E|nr:PocR ligand-binding domain-containing protein [Rhodobacter capsulatus]PZX23270.1 histidine kinase [Rhodobacter capsulatus]QNR61716.1 PocR ligand-binding domain-containing protein [Rhodobacter capsulatus]